MWLWGRRWALGGPLPYAPCVVLGWALRGLLGAVRAAKPAGSTAARIAPVDGGAGVLSNADVAACVAECICVAAGAASRGRG